VGDEEEGVHDSKKEDQVPPSDLISGDDRIEFNAVSPCSAEVKEGGGSDRLSS